jgi:hypothetical protein
MPPKTLIQPMLASGMNKCIMVNLHDLHLMFLNPYKRVFENHRDSKGMSTMLELF